MSDWIHVGERDAPPFENGWTNHGLDPWNAARPRITKDDLEKAEAELDPGARIVAVDELSGTIFVLPAGYRAAE